MKIGLDINLSSRLVIALNALYGSDSLSFESVGNADDEEWLETFSREGGDAFIGRDRKILQRPNEIRALDTSGLQGIFLDYGKAPQKLHYIAAHVIYWWPNIEKLIRLNDGNSIYRVPSHMRSWSGVETLRVDDTKTPPRVVRGNVP